MSDELDEPMFRVPRMEALDYGPSWAWIVLAGVAAVAALVAVLVAL